MWNSFFPFKYEFEFSPQKNLISAFFFFFFGANWHFLNQKCIFVSVCAPECNLDSWLPEALAFDPRRPFFCSHSFSDENRLSIEPSIKITCFVAKLTSQLINYRCLPYWHFYHTGSKVSFLFFPWVHNLHSETYMSSSYLCSMPNWVEKEGTY